ncbi:MAG: ATP-binding protein, partial [Pirellulales bacterium]|nr:ATP-binding protein [Pirellulales bacterium]
AARPMAHAFNLMADRIEALLRSQRELLQAVSHELRTPLARIRFAAALVETANTEEDRNRRLQAIDDATQQLDDLVGELLTYIRAESGSTVEPELVSTRKLLHEAIDAHEPFRSALNLELAQDCDDLTILIDRRGLFRAISNLVRNSVRFARSKVTLSSKRDDDVIYIRVDDDGPGVAECDRERIFQPFVRLDESGEGSGLGLALVQRIVGGQGGQVHVTQSPSGGARFEIVLAPGDPLEMQSQLPTQDIPAVTS